MVKKGVNSKYIKHLGGIIMYELDREVVFKGTDYKVVSVLDNNLLLVVSKKDLENEKFPMQTHIIPDGGIAELRK
ncbi:hypothetical protein DJ027_22585 [Bacillus cereus]|nr:hypothetical protein DJ027_22585 [Bacillus cereus]